MCWSVVKFQTPKDSACFLRRKSLVECSWAVGIQVVQDNTDSLCMGVVNVDKVAHAFSKIIIPFVLCSFCLSPSTVSIKEKKDIRDSNSTILVVLFCCLSWFHRLRIACISN